jgi:hypothetical protein
MCTPRSLSSGKFRKMPFENVMRWKGFEKFWLMNLPQFNGVF